MKKRDLEFFLSHTKINGDCLEWTRCFNSDGYPRCSWDGHFNGKVHRIVWELYNGESPKDQLIRHKCDNPKCINPEHLLIGSLVDNVRDMDERGRRYKGVSQEEVDKVKFLLSQGYKQTEISKQLGISYGRVQYINHKR